ncbi:MAG: nicotinate (nicotinamide) nucleotide adenylyltransferase [Clostridia bacterium]|nr:nicotinate (nicotinamide) nucleotide adenylyltransferase [Clostridia bacterium]
MKIGFFGGSFNPPTNAHINLAKRALKECKLDKVIFVPIGDFYPKEGLASGKDRYNMLKLACKMFDNIEVSDIEINLKEQIYAIDAFSLIEETYPNIERFFIVGADNFEKIVEWKKAEEIIEKYNYIVLERKNIDIEKHIEENKILKRNKDKIQIISNEEYRGYSSTKFRNLLSSKKIEDQDIIPKEVLEYIIKNELYNNKNLY